MTSAFFAVNKPRGISSAQVVGKVKHILKQNGVNVKVGNMGTLDVDADGVLVIALGKATKFFQFFFEYKKTYQTDIQFGIETDTLDSTGKVLNTSKKVVKINEIKNALPKFIGEQLQMPPMYSAKKVGGKRAYMLARDGVEVELSPKKVYIYNIELNKQNLKNNFTFTITCSSGTYIRAIARDLAKEISTYGITTRITRTTSSIFDLTNALDYNNLSIMSIENSLKSINEVINFKAIDVTQSEVKKLLDGLKVNRSLENGMYFLKLNNSFVMLAECFDNQLKININLMEAMDD